MPKLACYACGRQIYTVASVEALLVEERRCPRCGALLADERRLAERRQIVRRGNAPNASGPPQGVGERRVYERRAATRRRADRSTSRV